MSRFCCVFLLTISSSLSAFAQGSVARSVDPAQSYFRVWAAVPMIGSGTAADPFRPKYLPAPAPDKAVAARRDGIIAFSYTLSDDGKTALVQLFATNRDAFKDVLADGAAKSFAAWNSKTSDIQSSFQQYKKDFQLSDLRVAVQ